LTPSRNELTGNCYRDWQCSSPTGTYNMLNFKSDFEFKFKLKSQCNLNFKLGVDSESVTCHESILNFKLNLQVATGTASLSGSPTRSH